MLEPNDARVCMLDDDVPDLAGIGRVGVEVLRDAPKIPRSKAPNWARDAAYPCKLIPDVGQQSGPRLYLVERLFIVRVLRVQ